MKVSAPTFTDGGQYLFWSVLAVSCLFLAVGLFEPFVLKDLWTQRLVYQAALLALPAALVSALLVLLPNLPTHRLANGAIGSVGVLFLLVLFGPIPCLAGALVISCCFTFGLVFFSFNRTPFVPATDVLAVGFGLMILVLTIAGLSQVDMRLVFGLIIGSSLLAPLSRPVRDLAVEILRVPFPGAKLELDPYISFTTNFILGFCGLFYAANAALPEASWDALVMHLLIPTQIARTGVWNFNASSYAFAVWPLGVDYLFSFAYVLGGELGAKFFNLLTFAVLARMLYRLTRDLHGDITARYAVMLLISIPLALVVTSSLFVENVLALEVLAALSLLHGNKAKPSHTRLPGILILMAALCAIKIHGFMIAIPIGVITLFEAKRQALSRRDLSQLILTTSLCLVVGLLPYLFAWSTTGNPIFMFKNSLFKSPLWSATDFVDNRWTGKLSPYLLYRMTFRTYSFLEGLPGAIGFGFAGLLAAGVTAHLFQRNRTMLFSLLVVAGYLAILLPQTQYVRYYYPIMPLLVLICCAGLAKVQASSARSLALVLTLIVTTLGIYKFPAGAWAQRTANLRADFNADDRHDLILRQAPERLANEFINSIAPTPPRVIFATVPYGAFLKGTPIYVDWYNYNLNAQLSSTNDKAKIASIIKEQNADYIVANLQTENPLYKNVVTFAKENFTPIASFGSLNVYKLGR